MLIWEEKNQACCCWLWFAGRAQKLPSVSHRSFNRWWELVLWLQPWVKAAVRSAEISKFTQTKQALQVHL